MDACPFEKQHPSQLQKDALFFMQLAYNQALEAWKIDEVPIGAIVEKDGHILGMGYNQVERTRDATAHAEMIAITQAARALGDWRLVGCHLYVTKEPCPMCTGACILSRLDTVHYAVRDPKMGGLGGGLSIHDIAGLNHRLKIDIGVLEEECRTLLQTFFHLKR
ncbi:MAG: tRNA-specific adenosine deaminase [Verrucomicrobia bacterium GWF2_51_19]|nr:MAG: tRNA-specific adenosine deaminase [Verrucomicrobia bacterium GWF2_51_19]HCJ12361.1 tRNA-specific adenosine deaminase [Opitutae bacterium]